MQVLQRKIENSVVSLAPLCLELVGGTVCFAIAEDPEFSLGDSWEPEFLASGLPPFSALFSPSPAQRELPLYTILTASWRGRGFLAAAVTTRHTSHFHLLEIFRSCSCCAFWALLAVYAGFSSSILCTLFSEVLLQGVAPRLTYLLWALQPTCKTSPPSCPVLHERWAAVPRAVVGRCLPARSVCAL